MHLSVEKIHGAHCTHEVDFLKKQNSVKIQLENLRTHKGDFMLSSILFSLHNCWKSIHSTFGSFGSRQLLGVTIANFCRILGQLRNQPKKIKGYLELRISWNVFSLNLIWKNLSMLASYFKVPSVCNMHGKYTEQQFYYQHHTKYYQHS